MIIFNFCYAARYIIQEQTINLNSKIDGSIMQMMIIMFYDNKVGWQIRFIYN